MTLRLHLLGDFEALDGAGLRLTVTSRKSRGLLAILASTPSGTVSRHRLSNILWGDRQDEQARANLRQTEP